MSDLTVYRSRDPEVLAAYKAAWDAVDAYVKETDAVLAEAGVGDYQTWRQQGGWMIGHFSGIDIPEGQKPPQGWRMNRDYAVPDKRTKAGREVAQRLAAVRHPGDPRQAFIGMPSDVFTGGGRVLSAGVRVLEDGGALYVMWTTDPAGHRESFRSRDAEVDLSLWERVKLSEYYAEVERADAAKAEGGAS